MVVLPSYHLAFCLFVSVVRRGDFMHVSLKPAGLSFLRIAAIVVLAIFAASAMQAQSTAGRIIGSVHDQQDAAIAAAKITVTDTLRNFSRSTVSDDSGDYVVADLQPSTYRVVIEARGFNGFQAQSVLLEVGKDVRIDATLKTGDSNVVVTITGDVPMLDSTTSALGGTLSNKEINDLPLNGRNYENLLQLRPGVVRYPGGGFSTTSTNGLRAEDNSYLIDGLFNSETFSGQSIINGAGIAGDSATILPVDSIQEFNLQQNPPAEYGWKPGAIVNVGLKAGTNDIHGTAYAFGRDTPFDARNFFNPVGQAKNPRNLEQFGGTAGGAIIKGKLFYFGGYEGQRYTVGNTSQFDTWATVPLPDAGNCAFSGAGDCANSIPDAIADVFASGRIVSPVSLQIAGCTFTPPNTVSCNGKGFPINDGTNAAGPTVINYGLPNTVSVDNAIGKVDFRPNDHNSFSSLYFFGNNSGTVADALQVQPQWLTDIHTRAQVFGENWTWVPSARWVNEARFGYNRLYSPTFLGDHSIPS